MQVERITQLDLLEKLKDAIEIFVFDFADRLLAGDSITAINTIELENQNQVEGSTDISLVSQATGGTQVQLTYSEGTPGEFYLVRVFVDTSFNEKLPVEGMIKVN